MHSRGPGVREEPVELHTDWGDHCGTDRSQILADDETALDGEARTRYRSMVMRAAFLAIDRVELQFAVKELARSMQQPSGRSANALRRLIRFLVGHPRVIQQMVRQA